ncbi:MAG TPA: bis-aminopropyl spermidine synthase family protein [Firmicutes bacterium]|nr:bis-aminopropyl spermidine synthase family protein [Candidatus Fermentithermobacillaceae bacterium]
MLRIERAILSRLDHPMDFYELVSGLDYDLRSIISALNGLGDRGFIRVRDGLIERTVDFQDRRLTEAALEVVKREFARLTRNRPEPVVRFDQGYVTVESVMNRLRVLDSRDDLAGASLLLVGDDDLTSLAVCLTGLPARVAVAEIDRRLLDFLDQRRQDLPIPLELYEYDVRSPLPAKLLEAFDVSLCDPLETEQGFRLFVMRCREALVGPGSALYFGLTDVECPPERWLGFQEFLVGMGLRITDLWRSLHRYVLPERDFVLEEIEGARKYIRSDGRNSPRIPWYHSSLVRAELVSAHKRFPRVVSEGADIYH